LSSALTTVHPKAIYIHQGQQYHVENLDFDKRKAYVKPVNVDYYTDAIRYTQVRVLEVAEEEMIAGRAARAHGDVLVRSQVVGFKKIKFFTNENVGSGKLELPENEMHTTSFWLTLGHRDQEGESQWQMFRSHALRNCIPRARTSTSRTLEIRAWDGSGPARMSSAVSTPGRTPSLFSIPTPASGPMSASFVRQAVRPMCGRTQTATGTTTCSLSISAPCKQRRNIMENHEHKHQVRIHIDEKPYESPNPTTGEALYKLGSVQPGYDLFREVRGDKEDPIVENDDDPIHLREDEHFHSGPAQPRKFTIIVNGQKRVVTTKTVTFEEIVKLAFPTPPPGTNILYTVSYEDGPRKNPQGSMKEGQSVKVKNGMIFNVTATDKS
jgi:hypothetical protein